MKYLVAVLILLSGPALAGERSLRVGTMAFPQALGNPYVGASLPMTLPWHAIFDTLTRLDDDAKAVPALATAWRAEDPLTWVFELRRGVTFHDGEPFNADAVVAAVEVLRSPVSATRTLNATLRMVARAVKRDDYTVAIITDAPTVLLPEHMRHLRIPAPGAWARLGPDEFAKAPVGSGPFAITRWDAGEIDARAFAGGWRKARVDGLVIRHVPDGVTRAAALSSGALDVALGLGPEDRAEVEAAGGRLVPRHEPLVHFMNFVTSRDSPVKDARVRIALNLAVNRQRLIDSFLAGATTPATQFGTPTSFGFDPGRKGFGYDPARARVLLAEAGYPKGFDLVVTVVPGQGYETIYQQIAAELGEIGVRVTLKPVPLAQFTSLMRSAEWPGPAYANAQSAFDPIETIRVTSCVGQPSFHCPAGVAALVERARATFDVSERIGLAREIQAAQALDPPSLLLWQGVAFDGVAARVSGYRVVQDMVPFEDIELAGELTRPPPPP